MKLTKNFHSDEFRCKCGCNMPNDVFENIEILAIQLQALRDYVGRPIRINSAYRCESHNKAIKGSKRSQHLLGKASDITIDTFTPDEVVDIIENMLTNEMLPSFYVGGVGRYNSFTHLDIRKVVDKIARWDNRTK